MTDETQEYIPAILMKFANIDTAYIFVAVILVAYIYQARNILDIIYLGVVTYYYIRIKIHRWRIGS